MMMDSMNLKDTGFKTNDELQYWDKCYWYLRFLIDTNRFGALGKNISKCKFLYENILTAYKLLNKEESSEDKIKVLDSIFYDTLFDKVKNDSKKFHAYVYLYDNLQVFLVDPKDYFVLALTIKELLLPTNEAIQNVPSNECVAFAKLYGKAILDSKNEKGLSNLIREWDIFTETIALNRERDLIVNLISSIRGRLQLELGQAEGSLNDHDMDVIISAISQEFERRTGQKRKQRAGNDLESVTQFIFDYFKIKTGGGPEHISTGLEVDNWIKDKNGYYIGISLKRTLRERWKQTYTTDTSILDRNRIKYVIHIINNDIDLSDAKLSELGSYRHLFFLADDSKVLEKYKNHIVTSKYVFPMSQLIVKIKEFMQ
ncbi:hypothetical protein KIH41_13875 [Litoribacter ruber]|uniref:hypothetical protein n=1 Tax=Litoribacter ruber TaxID=702568 RepID=UPI001BDACBC3|nr:hypothetical protein [Litoribacter ruber]MBT0812370.1 hypothetical protein [Litoribacter ruber]